MASDVQWSSGWARSAALVCAVVAVCALVLQLVLVVQLFANQGQGTGAAVWRYLGFFTILTNIGVAVVATALALNGPAWFTGARFQLAVATCIILVGLVYSIALRSTWQPTGLQAIADHLLHDATPPLFAVVWLLQPHGSLHWRDTFTAILPALAYFAYAMVRGAVDGWYAYWFLDLAQLSVPQLIASIIGLTLGFAAMAMLLIALDRRLGQRSSRAR